MQSTYPIRRTHTAAAFLLTLALAIAGIAFPSVGARAESDAAIRGTVTSEGFPAWGVEVVAVPAGSDITSDGIRTSTGEDGTYLLDGLDPETSYGVRFEDPSGRFVSDTAGGTPLYAVTDDHVEEAVAVGSTLDHDMTPSGQLTGDVASLGGDRVVARVTAYTTITSGAASEWVRVADTTAGDDGVYVLTALDPRVPLRLVYSDDDGTWLPTSYGSGRVGGSVEDLLDAGADVTAGDDVVQQTLITAEERAAFVPRLDDGAPRVARPIALVNPPLGEYRAQWMSDGSPIAEAIAPGYTPTPAQLGATLTLAITVLDVNDRPVTTETSAPTSPVAAGTFSGSIPVISGADSKGIVRFGTTLTAVARSWAPGTPSLSYQWKIAGVDVVGAVSSTWKVTAPAVGKPVTVSVTATGDGFDSLTRTSAATKPVVALTLTAATPKISGKAAVGRTVTASAGKWTSGTALSYQWLSGGRAISGATKSTLSLGASLLGKSISVKVTGRLSGYGNAARTSTAVKVGRGTLTSPTPTITGSARVGSTLTAKPGSWTSGTTLRYQWYLNGVAIPRATSSKLAISNAGWKGRTVTVRVTGSKSGYTSVARTSSRTAAIAVPGSTKPSSTTSCPSWAPIKGNASSHIYHMPGQRFYTRTHPEVCFSSESAARAAGYRKSKV